jgi:hypothetical protein
VAPDSKTPPAGPNRPLGSPEIPQFHLPGGSSKGTYAPRLYGAASIHFGDKRRRVDETRRVAFLLPLESATRTIDWEGARPIATAPDQLVKDPPVRTSYQPLPAGSMELKTFTRWAKAFDRWLARTQRLEVAPKTESADASTIGPRRGGVSVELVAIVWELT